MLSRFFPIERWGKRAPWLLTHCIIAACAASVVFMPPSRSVGAQRRLQAPPPNRKTPLLLNISQLLCIKLKSWGKLRGSGNHHTTCRELCIFRVLGGGALHPRGAKAGLQDFWRPGLHLGEKSDCGAVATLLPCSAITTCQIAGSDVDAGLLGRRILRHRL